MENLFSSSFFLKLDWRQPQRYIWVLCVLATLMRLTPDEEENDDDRESAKDQLAQQWENFKKDIRGGI